MKTNPNKEILDAMHKDPQNWKGPFYYNKNDQRVMVKKQNPAFGWTFNFANTKTYLIILLAMIIILSIQNIIRL
jgi:uncharacterized membrane protein